MLLKKIHCTAKYKLYSIHTILSTYLCLAVSYKKVACWRKYDFLIGFAAVKPTSSASNVTINKIFSTVGNRKHQLE